MDTKGAIAASPEVIWSLRANYPKVYAQPQLFFYHEGMFLKFLPNPACAATSVSAPRGVLSLGRVNPVGLST